MKIPTPPPGKAKSNWFWTKSDPVFVTWTIIDLPEVASEVLVKVSLAV